MFARNLLREQLMSWIFDSILTVGYKLLDFLPISKDFLFAHEMQKKAYVLGAGLEDALKYNLPVHSDAYKAGVPLDDVLNFTNHAQLHAFQRNISLDIALRFSNHFQLYCYEIENFPLEKALNYSNGIFDEFGVIFNSRYIIYEDCAPPLIHGICSMPTDFTSRLQFAAYELGVSKDEALQFVSYIHVAALSTGVSPEDALKFSMTSQLRARNNGLSVEDSLKFVKHIQTCALEAGAPLEHALKFASDYQLNALRDGGVVAEDALKFSSEFQLYALLDYKLPVEDALKFISYDQLKALSQGASIPEALLSGMPIEEASDKVMDINVQMSDVCLIDDVYDNASMIV